MENAYYAMGRRLRSGLVDNSISARELAERVGVTEETVKNWMCGRTRMPINMAIEICEIFNWPLDRLAVRGEYADQATK